MANISRSVRALLWDYVDLEQLIPRVSQRGETVTGTREKSTPLALHVDSLQRSIWHLLTTWEEIVREHAGLSLSATRVRAGWAVQHAIEVIRPRLRLLAEIGLTAVWPDGVPADRTGVDAVLEIVRLHGLARVVLGLTRHVDELFGTCWMTTRAHPSGCGRATLRRDGGSDIVYCEYCAAWCTWDEYRRYLGLRVAYAKHDLALSS